MKLIYKRKYSTSVFILSFFRNQFQKNSVKIQQGKLIFAFQALVLLFTANGVTAQSEKGYWQSTPAVKNKESVIVENKRNLTQYKLFELDVNSLATALSNSPKRNAGDTKVINIAYFPDADGKLESYSIFETSNMEPELAASFPEIKSYVGRGIDDPTAIIYFSLSPLGLQTMLIRADQPAVFIEPYTKDLSAYAVYKKGDKTKSLNQFECRVIASVSETIDDGSTLLRPNADDGNYRSFRLALSVTGEYTTFFGGTKALALAAMNNSMTRVNGVFEIDFGVHMNLIANDTVLIYTNAATDPYSAAAAGAAGAWNQELQTNLTNVIGNAGYDIGHLFGASGGGGNAGCIACVCVNPTGPSSLKKGSGFTSPADAIPSGDNFDIDYVAHEMGHQFGGNHTFTFSNEGTVAQCEPGSGSTIMGYAGITGSTDVQPHSDAYFHAVSIQQITNYIKTTTCQTTTVTGNAIPTASAGSDFTIPIGTPFALTGVSTDANDAGLTYCWEQMDVGSSSTTFPSVTATSGVAFRSFTPVSSPVHYFPRLSTIQAGATSWTWEAIPNVARSMNFRFTVRDNHAGGPANNSDDMIVTFSTSSGPFVVTAPNTAVTWGTGTTQTVTWNVAGTTGAPVSCANVKISLSTDGGNTFPTVLLASTTNDGTENITVPNSPTTLARVKVEAVGNIFFDMSNVNFTIQAASPVLTTITTGALASNNICRGNAISVNYVTDGPANAGNYFKAQLSNAAGSFTTPVNLDSVLSINGGTINTTIPAGTATGSGYRIRVVSSNPPVIGSDNGANISIFAIPGAAGIITGSTTVCKGQTGVVYSVPVIANATWYNWILPSGGSITAGALTNSITVTFSAVAASGNITVYGYNNGCNGTSSLLGITAVAPIPTTGTQTFNGTGITINDITTATPYPATIAVSGLTGLTQDVNVTITGLTHTYPDDIDILLESPTGQRVTLMSDCGLNGSLSGVNLSIDDAAASNLPDGAGIVTGSYKPTNFVSPDPYASPGPGSFAAPLGASSTALSTCNGFSPNGTWNLYLVDDVSGDLGTITSWSLVIVVPFDTSVITGTSSVCPGQNGVAYSIPAVTNATGYNWSLPSGATIATGTNTNSITVNFSGGAVSGNISVTPFNICGNGITSKTFNVNVSSSGTASVSIAAVPSGSICAGTSVTFTATPTNGGGTPTYQWKKNSVNVGTGTTYVTTSLANNDTVKCVMTSNASCVAGNPATSNSIVTTVNTSVTAGVSIAAVPSGAICTGTSVTFTATPVNGGGAPAYQWKKNSVNVSTGSIYTTSSLSNNDTVICVMTSDLGSCLTGNPATSNSIIITVNPAVSAGVSISANPGNTICSGTSVTFTATPVNGGSGPVYTWRKNGVIVRLGPGTYTTTALANNDTLVCSMTSNATCVTGSPATSNSIFMTVNPNVTASVTIAPIPSGAICAGTNVTFTATPANEGTTPIYQWKKNGSNVGINSVTYSDNGLNNSDLITCLMTSNAPCVSGSPDTSNTITMIVNANVTASVTIAAVPSGAICAGTNVTFTATPANGGTTPIYQWKKNGSNVGINNVTYSDNGLNNSDLITCVMTSNVLCVSGSPDTSNTITMNVIQNVTASVTIAAVPSGSICAGTNVTFTATPANGGTTPIYQWKKNGSNVGINSVTYSDNGLNNSDLITCVMTSNAPCVSGSPDTSNIITMTVNANVTASITIAAVPSGAICAGTNVTFTATPANGGATPIYQWKKNGSNVGINSVTYSDNGLNNSDLITCVMTSNAPCVSGSPDTSNTITMIVNANVTTSVTIAAVPSGAICAGTNVTFTATPTNGGTTPSYQWKKNGANVGTNSATYSDNGLDNLVEIACIMTSNAPCISGSPDTSNTITMNVIQNVTASVTIAAVPSGSICVGTNVTFTATPTNGGATPSYQWKKNGANVGTNSATYSDNGLDNLVEIACIMTSNAPCVSGSPDTSNTITLNVIQNVTASVTVEAVPSGAICAGTNVTFTATPANGGPTPSYQWKKNGANVGTNSVSYSDNGLNNSDLVTCVMTSNAPCVSGSPDTSNTVTMIVSSCSSNITLNLKIFIEGFYDGNGLMKAVADPSGYPALCDTFIVNLHEASPPYDLVESANGTIGTDGNGSFDFLTLTTGNSYFVVVRHRNAMETWSKTPVLFNSSLISFDFTSP